MVAAWQGRGWGGGAWTVAARVLPVPSERGDMGDSSSVWCCSCCVFIVTAKIIPGRSLKQKRNHTLQIDIKLGKIGTVKELVLNVC
jgi:hypothetical protein